MACKINSFSAKFFSGIFLSLIFIFSSTFLRAEDHTEELPEMEITTENDGHETKKFNAGNMILEHVKDAYDWHIMDLNGHPISLPLPVIIYSPEKGLDIFLSSKFEHGHASYKGYKLENGKIVSEDNVEFYDLSITKNVAALLLSIFILCGIFISVAKAYTTNKGKAPKGLQSFMEPLILFIRDEVAKPSIGHKYEKFVPYLLSIFFFIWINNTMGLIPIFPFGANVTGNIAVTLVLAMFTFAITLFNSNKNYWAHIFKTPGVPLWLLPIMVPIEIMGLFIKPGVLMLRLFANITAGHIIVLSFFSLIFIFAEKSLATGYGVSIVSLAFSLFMNVLELLVAFLQAYVFTLLSALYFGMAVEEHH